MPAHERMYRIVQLGHVADLERHVLHVRRDLPRGLLDRLDMVLGAHCETAEFHVVLLRSSQDLFVDLAHVAFQKMVAPEGFEPSLPESKSGRLPLSDSAMVEAGGIEPPSAENYTLNLRACPD